MQLLWSPRRQEVQSNWSLPFCCRVVGTCAGFLCTEELDCKQTRGRGICPKDHEKVIEGLHLAPSWRPCLIFAMESLSSMYATSRINSTGLRLAANQCYLHSAVSMEKINFQKFAPINYSKTGYNLQRSKEAPFVCCALLLLYQGIGCRE